MCVCVCDGVLIGLLNKTSHVLYHTKKTGKQACVQVPYVFATYPLCCAKLHCGLSQMMHLTIIYIYIYIYTHTDNQTCKHLRSTQSSRICIDCWCFFYPKQYPDSRIQSHTHTHSSQMWHSQVMLLRLQASPDAQVPGPKNPCIIHHFITCMFVCALCIILVDKNNTSSLQNDVQASFKSQESMNHIHFLCIYVRQISRNSGADHAHIITSRALRPPHCVCSETPHSCPRIPQVRAKVSLTRFCIRFRLGGYRSQDLDGQLFPHTQKKQMSKKKSTKKKAENAEAFFQYALVQRGV